MTVSAVPVPVAVTVPVAVSLGTTPVAATSAVTMPVFVEQTQT